MKKLHILMALLALLPLLPARAAGPEEEAVLLPILMYHEVRCSRPGKDSIYPEELEADLRWLQAAGYTAIGMERLIDYVYSGSPLPEKPVILSFDDGCGSCYENVLPLLRRYGTTAVLSVIGESTDEFSQYPETGRCYAHMSWKQLRELAESGLAELQNHSYALHRLQDGAEGCRPLPGESPADYEARLTEDARLLQQRLLEETGQAASTYTYPYGFYTDSSHAILAEMGFRATLTCDFGINRISRDPACLLGLRRICRSHGCDLAALLEEAASFSGLRP